MEPNTQQQQQTESPQQSKELRLNHKTLALASLVIGVLAVIFLFFPDLRILTYLFSIVGLALGIYIYIQERHRNALLGMILSAFPLFFFIQLKLIELYVKDLIKAFDPFGF